MGGSGGEELAFLDPPPSGPLQQARVLLQELGALLPNGQPTPRGRAMAALGLHPRLGAMVLRAADLQLPATALKLPPFSAEQRQALACVMAALLGERDPLRQDAVGADLCLRLDLLEQRGRSGAVAPIRQLALQLRRQLRLPKRISFAA